MGRILEISGRRLAAAAAIAALAGSGFGRHCAEALRRGCSLGQQARLLPSLLAIAAPTKRSKINALPPAGHATATSAALQVRAASTRATRPRLATEYAATCHPTRTAALAATIAAITAKPVAGTNKRLGTRHHTSMPGFTPHCPRCGSTELMLVC